MLHPNPNCKIVQDSAKIMNDMMVLKNNAKGGYNEKDPSNNLQKTAYI